MRSLLLGSALALALAGCPSNPPVGTDAGVDAPVAIDAPTGTDAPTPDAPLPTLASPNGRSIPQHGLQVFTPAAGLFSE